ncbi:hypothetical protein [Leptonema illini]|uniref:Dinitrogenase iron-molybdenum cofactor biosynthesis domain-containing protein n=1 Tax=Leptonema illini DSM 21528 TaxID=929563 RepID=H2CBQ6_9LEPT|nr:hypothetical protein [Leptonema illini]EHQ08510.1 hypothetical protein Lepil_3857 [Leptonema illini DSM 21528]
MTITVALAAESDRTLRRTHFGAASLYSIHRRNDDGQWQHIADVANPGCHGQHGNHHAEGCRGEHHTEGHAHHHGQACRGEHHGSGHGRHREEHEAGSGEHRQPRGPGSKFRHIFSALKKHDVNVVGSVQYGPNIRNLRTAFTPVVVSEGSVDDALAAIERNLDQVDEQIRAGENRRHLMLRAIELG